MSTPSENLRSAYHLSLVFTKQKSKWYATVVDAFGKGLGSAEIKEDLILQFTPMQMPNIIKSMNVPGVLCTPKKKQEGDSENKSES